ncbi:hypothetical protein BXZ70DRAFT_895473 [Cristinia sonorae]|uniref:Uncharacterized protein n=1 Tax=Cristinia sonorae TaxID=1940300 RepID=A0A8K0UMZ1_9AGAR|nr:hypothetical protein BXZ70DRAFT_895473 [Cristinia sonorae]
MSHAYGSWSSSNPKDEQRQYVNSASRTGSSRRSGSGEHQQTFAYPESYMQVEQQYGRGSARRPATGSSSLSGAMGDLNVSSSNSPPSIPSSPSGMSWTPSPTSAISESYAALPSADAGAFSNYRGTTSMLANSVAYNSYNNAVYPDSSPESTHTLPSGVPSSAYPETQLYYPQSLPATLAVPNQGAVSMTVPVSASSPAPIRSSGSRPDRMEAEIQHLRNKIRELELINKSARERVRELEHEVARVNYTGSSSAAVSGLPSPLPTPTLPTSHGFLENWQARTDARVKLFCSLNRAGNALCAWHDSRRERRQFPPRNAPPGYLNCGCTYEEALFEESLARHGVGSYHPGESVRMDPTLRNPLLKLLQNRYGYRDGDFERDPHTGNWVQGEGAASWEARAVAGAAAVRRQTRADSS